MWAGQTVLLLKIKFDFFVHGKAKTSDILFTVNCKKELMEYIILVHYFVLAVLWWGRGMEISLFSVSGTSDSVLSPLQKTWPTIVFCKSMAIFLNTISLPLYTPFFTLNDYCESYPWYFAHKDKLSTNVVVQILRLSYRYIVCQRYQQGYNTLFQVICFKFLFIFCTFSRIIKIYFLNKFPKDIRKMLVVKFNLSALGK